MAWKFSLADVAAVPDGHPLRGRVLSPAATEPPLGSRPGRVTVPGASALRAGTGDNQSWIPIGSRRTAEATGFSNAPAASYYDAMDRDNVDEAVMTLLCLGIHQRDPAIGGARAWKSLDWEAMDRLYRKSLISDPVSKAKSVLLTEAGLREAEAAFRRLFTPED